MKTTFKPRRGIAIDPTPAELSPDFWSDCWQFRFEDGRAIPFRQGQALQAPPDTPNPGDSICYHLIRGVPNQDLPDQGNLPDPFWISVGKQKVWVTTKTPGVWADIGEPGFWIIGLGGEEQAELPNLVSSAILNGEVWMTAANSGVSYLHYWQRDASETFEILVGPDRWPDGTVIYGGIAASKYHLFVFNMGGPSIFNENTVMWSSGVEPGQSSENITFIPGPENEAGFVDLADTPGGVIDATMVGDYLWIAKNRSLYTAQYIGGQFVYAFRLRNDSVGVASRHCMTEVDGRLFIVTPSDAGFVNPDGTFESVANGRVREFIVNNNLSVDGALAQGIGAKAVFLVHHPDKKEIWIHARTQAQGEEFIRSLWIYKYDQDTWGCAGGGGNALPYHARHGEWPWPVTTDSEDRYFVVVGGAGAGNVGALFAADTMNEPTVGYSGLPYLKRSRIQLNAEDPQLFSVTDRINVLGGKLWEPYQNPRVEIDVVGYPTRGGPIDGSPLSGGTQDAGLIDLDQEQQISLVCRGRYMDIEITADSLNYWYDGFTVEHQPDGEF